MAKIHKGSCLCGGVRYEISGELKDVMNCHCSKCRKAHAAAFRTRCLIKSEDFRWIRGEHLLTYYESSPGRLRSFCKVCGSNLITKFQNNQDIYGFPLATLDTDPGIKPEGHCFAGSKAPWYDITDGLPQCEEMPPVK